MSDTKIASDWTASTGSTRYDLPGGQWVEFRDEVPYGEQADIDKRCKKLDDEDAFPIRLAAVITSWSLTYPNGNPLPICPESIASFGAPRILRLIKTLSQHNEAMKASYADPLSEDDLSSASPSAA